MNGGYTVTDRDSKRAWEKENVIQCAVKVNRNQDPELYELLKNSYSASGMLRDLAREALAARKSRDSR